MEGVNQGQGKTGKKGLGPLSQNPLSFSPMKKSRTSHDLFLDCEIYVSEEMMGKASMVDNSVCGKPSSGIQTTMDLTKKEDGFKADNNNSTHSVKAAGSVPKNSFLAEVVKTKEQAEVTKNEEEKEKEKEKEGSDSDGPPSF
jgi:hypothetical protein